MIEYIRKITLNEKEIKEIILSEWANDNEVTAVGFFTEHCGIRTKDHLIFESEGTNIKLKKIIFEFEEEDLKENEE